MRKSLVRTLPAAFCFCLALGCQTSSRSGEGATTRIGFGSCINTQAHPMLDRVLTLPFDHFILLGDNIYADTTNAAVMAQKYRVRKESEFFTQLRRKAKVLATWDDHDYGANDAGSNYPMKATSQKLFLDFLEDPADSPRRKRAGIYAAYRWGSPGRRVQVILLDTRYFRSTLRTGENNVVPSGGKYVPHSDPKATLLGEDQWLWLERQLKKPADLRIMGSSIQFVSEFSGAESWANLPLEKQRMLGLLRETRTGKVFFISGDRHWAELSRMDRPGGYPLYDLTSSALTVPHPRGTPTPNRYRDGPTLHQVNVGLIQIDWLPEGPSVHLQIIDQDGQARIERRLSF